MLVVTKVLIPKRWTELAASPAEEDLFLIFYDL